MKGSAAGMWIDLEYPTLRGEFLRTMNKFSCDFSVDLRNYDRSIRKQAQCFTFDPVVTPLEGEEGRGGGEGGEGRGEGTQFFRPKPSKKQCFFVQKAHKNILHDLLQDPDTF